MWLCTQIGFFSIVEKPAGKFHVRARCIEDLHRLVELVGIEQPIHRTLDGDYPCRIVIGRPELRAIFANLADTIDYSNFKNRIYSLPDQLPKVGAYSQLWGDLAVLPRDSG